MRTERYACVYIIYTRVYTFTYIHTCVSVCVCVCLLFAYTQIYVLSCTVTTASYYCFRHYKYKYALGVYVLCLIWGSHTHYNSPLLNPKQALRP